MLEAFITVLFTNTLPVALIILGVLCVGVSIVGRIPPIDIKGARAFFLGSFGAVLIIVAIGSAWILASVSQNSSTATPVAVATTNTPQSISATQPKPANTPNTVQTTSQETTVASPLPATQITGNCPYRELADEINIGDNSGACAAMPLAQFLEIMNSSSLQSAINTLDRAFEADIRIGYQYRQVIPARIPPAPARQRVMWGSLAWVDELSASERDNTNSRIFRIWCNYTNPCIYVILDGDEFYVGFPGRGLLLDEPLSNDKLNQLRK
jgi:hypothetical protein